MKLKYVCANSFHEGCAAAVVHPVALYGPVKEEATNDRRKNKGSES